jgi:hypothetical protein
MSGGFPGLPGRAAAPTQSDCLLCAWVATCCLARLVGAGLPSLASQHSTPPSGDESSASTYIGTATLSHAQMCVEARNTVLLSTSHGPARGVCVRVRGIWTKNLARPRHHLKSWYSVRPGADSHAHGPPRRGLSLLRLLIIHPSPQGALDSIASHCAKMRSQYGTASRILSAAACDVVVTRP